ncbi:hypothetical protein [Rhodobacter sp. 24-YEA-8]|uniref:hypothetical protein n=1 Tax=Rhodobacter sp. 24-YEA-8 TaxID=1884310 RepID=UPI0008985BFE|nr:hypothetical protein [Rhodobacter sp. 24-YEA-8]SEB47200.1 hypothetical protein SAMN05519105_0423 [Rhodobacter sp. 24-YEA-8]
MSRTIPLAAAVIVLGSLPALAALPPYFDRIEQMQTILASEAVAERLGGRPIDGLEYERHAEDGSVKWEIDTDGCDIDIWLDPQPMPEGMTGKVTYEVRTPVEACDS